MYGQFGTSDTAMIFPTGIDVFTVETEIDLYFAGSTYTSFISGQVSASSCYEVSTSPAIKRLI